MIRRILVWSLLMAAFAAPAVRAERLALIVCGAGGVDEYREKFHDWGVRLQGALTDSLGFQPDAVELLLENAATPETVSSLENLHASIDRLAARASSEDDVFLFLIGHGAALANQTRFMLPGPDLSPEQLNGWLESVGCRRVTVIAAASSSAGFINGLSGPGRVICTATKSVDEINAVEWMKYFLEGLESGDADVNFDERVSLLEALNRAAELTQSGYENEGLIQSEHSLLDDNGDGLGTRLPIAAPLDENADGALARDVYLKEYEFPEGASPVLVSQYLGVIDEIMRLKQQKTEIPEDEYYARLEPMLIQAATLNQTIHSGSIPAATPGE